MTLRTPGVLTSALLFSCLACAQSQPAAKSTVAGNPVRPEPSLADDASLYLKLQADPAVRLSKAKPGDVIEGKLSRDVYRADRELFPAGSRVRLTVDHLERQRRVPNDHWPWVVKVLTPRNHNSPTFSSATVFLADGREVPLQVSLIAIRPEREVRAQSRTAKNSENPPAKNAALVPEGRQASRKTSAQPTVVLAATELSPEPAAAFTGPQGRVTLAAGTQAKIILLGNVSASKSHAGDSFQARIVEPVRLDARIVLPEGTLLQGTVVKSAAPRMLSRSGSLLLKFTGITLPDGTASPVVASVGGADLDRGSHTRIDAEGRMTGDRPGKAWMILNIGVSAGISKIADDGTQLLIEALVSTATDVSTAGAGRIVSSCASGLFLLTRHGRDVMLPKFTEMNVTFDRPVSLFQPQSAAVARATEPASGQ
jgi:hypothetical protein